jgi:hypothetical protein
MKKILMITGIILVAAVIATGSFWGGMTYQTNKADQARLNFENARGLANGGQVPSDGAGFPGSGAPNGQVRGVPGGGGTAGQVKTIDENVMTISTAQDVITVNLSESTRIEKTVAGTNADLQPGTRIMVIGQKDADGNITASQITILTSTPADTAYPSPTGLEP